MKTSELLAALIVSVVAAEGAFSSVSAADKKAAEPGKKLTEAKMVCVNNDCHGNAELAGSGWDGKGKNTCGGQGLLKAGNETECTKKSGTWTAEKSGKS